MFHLWRKRLSLALFQNQIVRGGDSAPITFQTDRQNKDALFAAFTDVLLEAKRGSQRTILLSLAVSDSFAAIVALPWQSALSRTAEIDAYARAQFEHVGQPLDEHWTMFSYFRHFGAIGLAYALPTDFIQRLHDIAVVHNVVIDSILPLSALAYARQRRSKRGAKALVLCESSRITALVTGPAGLLSYATEPVAGGSERSVERLIRRLQIDHKLQAAEECVPEQAVEAALSSTMSTVLPSVRCTAADSNFWRR